MNIKKILIALPILLSCSIPGLADEISFSRDVLPILSDRCFHCHDPDESTREADLRLDLEDAAKGAAIVPGVICHRLIRIVNR